jgi:hypothetical protein
MHSGSHETLWCCELVVSVASEDLVLILDELAANMLPAISASDQDVWRGFMKPRA